MGLLLAAPAWVAGELGRQYVWDGFPWELLGYSQVTWLPIAQLASVVGVYGLSALLAPRVVRCRDRHRGEAAARWSAGGGHDRDRCRLHRLGLASHGGGWP